MFQIRYGLGGGFGGTEFAEWEDCNATTHEEAESCAYNLACEEYDSYEGLHGLRSIEDIMEDEELDEDTATIEYQQERESWLDYEVREL